jgi:hypothetical protein
MNPYLEHEDAWHNSHEQFPNAVVSALVPLVRPKYFVKVDQHVFIHEPPADERRALGRPDVGVGVNRGTRPMSGDGATAVATPQRVHLAAIDTFGLSFVEIRDRLNRRLVTVIELLRPSNKWLRADREQYEAKRAAVLTSRTNLVQVDLLRGGRRLPLADDITGDYGVFLSRASDRPDAEWYPIALRDRLPRILIPLDDNDPAVPLDLQSILDRLYDEGGYQDFIYDAEPDPPLPPEDAAWARDILADAGITAPPTPSA